MDFHIKMKLKISVEFVGAEKRIGAAFCRFTNDGAIFDTIGGGPIALGPAFEGLAVKEGNKVTIPGKGHGACSE